MIVAIVPILISSVMTSFAGTIIDVASSCTVSKSGISIVSRTRGGATGAVSPFFLRVALFIEQQFLFAIFFRSGFVFVRACAVAGASAGRRHRRRRSATPGRPGAGTRAGCHRPERTVAGRTPGRVQSGRGHRLEPGPCLCRPVRASPRRVAAQRRAGREARCAGRAKPRPPWSAAAPRGERWTVDPRAPAAAAESDSAGGRGRATGARRRGRGRGGSRDGGVRLRGAARRCLRRGRDAATAPRSTGARTRRRAGDGFGGLGFAPSPGERPLRAAEPPRRAPSLLRAASRPASQNAAHQIGDLVRHDAELILCLEDAAQALVEERRQLFRGEPDFFGELENSYFSGQVTLERRALESHQLECAEPQPTAWLR